MPLGKRPYSNEKSWEEIERCRNNLWYALDGLQKVDLYRARFLGHKFALS